MGLTQTSCRGLWPFIKSVCTNGEGVKQMHTLWVQGGRGFTFNLLHKYNANLHIKVAFSILCFGVNFITVLQNIYYDYFQLTIESINQSINQSINPRII